MSLREGPDLQQLRSSQGLVETELISVDSGVQGTRLIIGLPVPIRVKVETQHLIARIKCSETELIPAVIVHLVLQVQTSVVPQRDESISGRVRSIIRVINARSPQRPVGGGRAGHRPLRRRRQLAVNHRRQIHVTGDIGRGLISGKGRNRPHRPDQANCPSPSTSQFAVHRCLLTSKSALSQQPRSTSADLSQVGEHSKIADLRQVGLRS